MTPGAVLTDIEGTTSPITFVRDVLFPWARARLPSWLPAHASTPEVAALLDETRALAGAPGASVEALVGTLQAWIDADEKLAPLKALQGLMWAEGYGSGALRAPVYADVPPALRAWQAAGIPVAVYSSGSVRAQQLFFGHTDVGDLRALFCAWFDTRTGAKREAASYARIAEALATPAARCLFLSDVQAELDAARDAGMDTRLLVRDGPLPRDSAHEAVPTFDGLPGLPA